MLNFEANEDDWTHQLNLAKPLFVRDIGRYESNASSDQELTTESQSYTDPMVSAVNNAIAYAVI